MQFHINLTSFAVVLWSGMLIIAGSIWVLSSQVRKLADLMEEQGKAGTGGARVVRGSVGYPARPAARRRDVGRAATRLH